jgi:hypothetical protein
MYKCECCDKEMMKTSSWKLHIKTEKHILNLKAYKEKYKKLKICDKCYSVFIYAKNYNEHYKKCKKPLFDVSCKIEINDDQSDKIKNKESNNDENNKFKEENIKLEEENIKLKEENIKLKEENIKIKEENKNINRLEKENSEFKNEIKELKIEIKELNDKFQKILVETTDKFQNVVTNSNNDMMKICDKQLNFAQTVSKDSNKITSSAMTLLGFLQKQCPNAPPLLEFTNNNYEYTFTVDKDFVYDILYAFDNDTIGEFIGKIINTIFLKENKEDQSLFATDCVRLNYSIKEYINETKNKWTLDKGANKVKNIIINPLLNYFIKELKSYLQKENNKMMLSGTKKSDNHINSDKEIKQKQYDEMNIDAFDGNESDSDDSSEYWKSPEEISDDDDYMIKPITQTKKNTRKSLVVMNKRINNTDKLKNSNKYHKELTVKERDSIIRQSTKIIQFIKAIEDGVITKEVLKFITKFYQLDKSYFE